MDYLDLRVLRVHESAFRVRTALEQAQCKSNNTFVCHDHVALWLQHTCPATSKLLRGLRTL